VLDDSRLLPASDNPVPVEADIDPGAAVMDKDEADLAFAEIVERWLRHRLSGAEGGLIAEMVLHDPGATVNLIYKMLDHLRRQRTAIAPAAPALNHLVKAFRSSVTAFNDFLKKAAAVETETATIAAQFAGMAEAVSFAEVADDPASLIKLLVTTPDRDLCTGAGKFRAYQKKGKWAATAKLPAWTDRQATN